MSQPHCSLSLTYFLPRTCCRLTNFVFCLHVLAVFPARGQNTNSIMTETGLLFSSMFPGNLTVPDTKQVPTKCLWDKFGFGIQSSSWDVIPFGGKPSQMLSFMLFWVPLPSGILPFSAQSELVYSVQLYLFRDVTGS